MPACDPDRKQRFHDQTYERSTPMSLYQPRRLALLVAALCVAGCSPSESPAPDVATAPATESATAAPVAAAPTPDTAATLVANLWQLKTATDATGQSLAAFFPTPDKPLGVQFADGRVNVTGGCNRLSAAYQLPDATQLQVGQGMSTMMACPPPLAAADSAFARFLSGTLQVAIEGEAGAPQLRLAAADGTTLTFSGTPTPEARFGGPGTRAFLEVSPEPCVEPAPAARPCLMVRDRHFDEQGLASGSPGEWRALPEGIEGYTPVAGEQHVVRVKRFEQAGVAGAPPAEHFVLDMVIETRTLQ
jgi:heat shock protein HslJ